METAQPVENLNEDTGSYSDVILDSIADASSHVRQGIVIPAPHEDTRERLVVNLSSFDHASKRVLDLLTTFLALAIFSIPMILISLIIKLSSRGPIFYGQERVGLNGKHFTMWKFRSMNVNAEQEGAVWAIRNDPRRTKFGSFLRASSLDELPQIWNVLKGEMSIVGPRPERPMFVEEFKKSVPNYEDRHLMKSGITGWAQICGWRGNTSIENRVQYDLYYIKNWSIRFDIKILFLTLFRGFINKNAY
jgi:exopolysaccharide biosynthesis polyprenyl glycosylphosphotransferase